MRDPEEFMSQIDVWAGPDDTWTVRAYSETEDPGVVEIAGLNMTGGGGVPHSEAVAELELFLTKVTAALEALKARREYQSYPPEGGTA